jgi:hypothetical protein
VNRSTELTGRRRQIPDAVRDDEVETAICCRQRVHWGEYKSGMAHRRLPLALVAAAASIGLERSHPSTVHPTCASGTAFRPAPQPMSSAILAPACHSPFATRIKVALGAERVKPATVPGSLHDEPASGSSLAEGSPRFIIGLGGARRLSLCRASSAVHCQPERRIRRRNEARDSRYRNMIRLIAAVASIIPAMDTKFILYSPGRGW